jgi:hypothetical protein
MTELIEEGDVEVAEIVKIKIPVKAGHGDDRVIEVDVGDQVTVILEVIAKERGCGIDELVVVREGESEPVAAVIVIEADYPHQRRHHVHHVSEVTVTVFYQAGSEARAFKRSATIDHVLMWAIKAFKVDPSMASEFELTRHGQKDELPGTEHVGHLAGTACELALDLVRGDIANGGGA